MKGPATLLQALSFYSKYECVLNAKEELIYGFQFYRFFCTPGIDL